MWNVPGPGIELVSPALAGGFLSTVPPGKSRDYFWQNGFEVLGKNFIEEMYIWIRVGEHDLPFLRSRESWEFPGSPVVRTPALSLPRAWVQSFSRELRSCKPRGAVKKKKKTRSRESWHGISGGTNVSGLYVTGTHMTIWWNVFVGDRWKRILGSYFEKDRNMLRNLTFISPSE